MLGAVPSNTHRQLRRAAWVLLLLAIAVPAASAQAQQQDVPIPALRVPYMAPDARRCTPAGASDRTLQEVARRLSAVLDGPERAEIQRQITSLAARDCPRQRIGQFLLTLIVRLDLSFRG